MFEPKSLPELRLQIKYGRLKREQSSGRPIKERLGREEPGMGEKKKEMKDDVAGELGVRRRREEERM